MIFYKLVEDALFQIVLSKTRATPDDPPQRFVKYHDMGLPRFLGHGIQGRFVSLVLVSNVVGLR